MSTSRPDDHASAASLFRAFAEAHDEASLLVSADGGVLAASRAFQRLIDESGSDAALRIEGRRLEDLLADPESGRRLLRDCLRSAQAVPGRLAVRGPGAGDVSLRVQGIRCPIANASEERLVIFRVADGPSFAGFVALTEKIEELQREVSRRREVELIVRRREEALRESEARKSAILESALDAIVSIDGAGCVLEFNPAAESMFGIDRQQVLGRRISDYLMPSTQRDLFERGLEQYAATGESDIIGRRVEVRARRANGEEFPAEVAVTCIDTMSKPVFTGHIRDATERKLDEVSIREQMLLAAFGRDVGISISSVPEITPMLNRCVELMVEHLDAAFARIWLLEPESQTLVLRASAGMHTHLDGAHGRIPFGRFKIGRIAEERKPHLTNHVVGDEQIHDQEWARREGMVAFAGYPLEVEGRVIGVMALFARHELSGRTIEAMGSVASAIAIGLDRRQIEEKLRAQTVQLEQNDRRKDEFLAMLSHELRNPLAPLRTGLDVIEKLHGRSDNTGRMLQQIEHLARLIDDLLDVARITSGQIDLRREKVRASEVLERAVLLGRSLVDEKEQRLTISAPDEEVWLDADPVRLAQALGNLLHNAGKYTPEGGHVDVRVRCDREVVFTVEDDGVGIASDFLPRVFDLFAQGEVSLERSRGGLGIGLTLVKRLAELHGGSVSVHSEGLDRGSRFDLVLPRARRGPAATAATSDPAADESATRAPGSPALLRPREPGVEPRVLVADDSEDAALVMRDLLHLLDISAVDVAHDGAAAVELARRHRPHLVLLDIGLPGFDGYEVARRLRRIEELGATYLVAVTGYGAAEDRRRSAEAGFDLHLVKPIAIEQIEAVLARVRSSIVRS